MTATEPQRFWDAHTHLSAGAADLSGVDLRAAETADAIGAAIIAASFGVADSNWIRGWGWDGVVPVPDVSPSHPVFLARRDGHAAWVNATARAALGLPMSEGILAEAAFDAARSRLPERQTAERLTALRPRLQELVEAGVATVERANIVLISFATTVRSLRGVGELVGEGARSNASV